MALAGLTWTPHTHSLPVGPHPWQLSPGALVLAEAVVPAQLCPAPFQSTDWASPKKTDLHGSLISSLTSDPVGLIIFVPPF